jgi:hypothetical protein
VATRIIVLPDISSRAPDMLCSSKAQASQDIGKMMEIPPFTSRENLSSGAPVFIFCGAWVVRHRIFTTKIRILWRTSTCATEIRHSVAHQFICATEIRHSVAHES